MTPLPVRLLQFHLPANPVTRHLEPAQTRTEVQRDGVGSVSGGLRRRPRRSPIHFTPRPRRLPRLSQTAVTLAPGNRSFGADRSGALPHVSADPWCRSFSRSTRVACLQLLGARRREPHAAVRMTEEELVRRAKNGDRDAFGLLGLRYNDLLQQVARRMLLELMDAQDAVQDTLLRALQGIDRFDPALPFRAWILTILMNQCRTRYRERRRRRLTFVLEPSLVDQHPAPDQREDGEVERIIVAVNALSPRLREAFILKHVEDLDYREMRAITGVGISALKMRVRRACRVLRGELDRGDPPDRHSARRRASP